MQDARQDSNTDLAQGVVLIAELVDRGRHAGKTALVGRLGPLRVVVQAPPPVVNLLDQQLVRRRPAASFSKNEKLGVMPVCAFVCVYLRVIW